MENEEKKNSGKKPGQSMNIVIIMIIVAAVVLIFYSKSRNCCPFAPAKKTGGASIPAAIAEKPDAKLKLPVLVELGADKCHACKQMKPVLDSLRRNYSSSFGVRFIDVWKNRDKATEYNVQAIPTQIFIDGSGKELFRHTGFFSEKEILAKWAELGIKPDSETRGKEKTP